MTKRHSLVIGISDYTNLRELDNVVRDAEAIAKKLAASGFEVERYPCKWIEAEQRYEIKTTSVTKDKLLETIETFLFETAKNSEAIVYLAGHGLRVKSASPRIAPKGYLAVSNSQGDGNMDLLFADLNELFALARNEAHLSSLVVLFDCCHAGMAFEETVERQMLFSAFSAFQEQSKFGILAACRGHQEAYEQGEHGLFTSALLEGLEQTNADKRGVVSFNRLADFVKFKLQGTGQQSVDLAFEGSSIEIINYSLTSSPENSLTLDNQDEFIRILPELNYNREDSVFTDFLDEDLSVGFFWINSEQEGGQRWLINRFWQKKVPFYTDAIKHHLVIKKRWKITTLWEKISQQLQVEESPEKIYHKLYDHWNTGKTVALALYGIEYFKRSDIEQFYQEFWLPLVTKVQTKITELQAEEKQYFYQYPLILFLVNTGFQDNCNCCLESIQQYNCQQPCSPVELTLTRFRNNTIRNWSNHYVTQLNSLKKCTSMAELNQQVIDCNNRKDTSSEEVLAEICELCNHDWEEHFASKFVI